MVTNLGKLHSIPKDLDKAIKSSRLASLTWADITPLARNEWICWVISVKKDSTRKDHIVRAREDLAHGKRRPCCFAGCPHR